MDSTVRLGYAEKTMRAAAAKERIGRSAANLVPDGAAIFLDVGTTVEAVARALKERAIRLHVFTNSLACAMLLTGEPDLHLHVFGGSSRGADGSLVGARTLAEIETIHFDFAFIGFSGFATDGTILDYDLERSQSSRRQCGVRSSQFWLVIIRSLLARQSRQWGAPAISPILSPILRLRIFSCLLSPKQSSKSSKQVDGSDLQNGTVASGNHVRRFSSLLLRFPAVMRALRSTGVTNRQSK